MIWNIDNVFVQSAILCLCIPYNYNTVCTVIKTLFDEFQICRRGSLDRVGDSAACSFCAAVLLLLVGVRRAPVPVQSQ